jgi:hypothetical protein
MSWPEAVFGAALAVSTAAIAWAFFWGITR